jgi:YVTN family beta-propeller protein
VIARSSVVLAVFVCAALGCRGERIASAPARVQPHSSSLAASTDGTRLYVVHPDADSVSRLDLASRRIVQERTLSAQPPALDTAGRYEPAVSPRALALNAAGDTLYVTGQRSGRVYALDAQTLEVRKDAPVCAEPMGVLVSADDASVFIACSQDDAIVQLSASKLERTAREPSARKPWALAWAADGETLLATHFLGPGVSRFHTQPLARDALWSLADGAQPDAGVPTGDRAALALQPHGVVRGLYDAQVRPGTSELWIAHLMLGNDTPQPQLDFQRTVFPSVSILDSAGTQLARLSVQADPSSPQAFGDVVSGPHALAFTDDGKLAFVVDENSEDLLVIDAEQRIEAQLVRPLPGHMPEGALWTHDRLYVQERNSEDIVAFRVERHDLEVEVLQDGPAWHSSSHDPMPAELRLGQKVFYSANSDDVPTTQNHWVACASCHLEGRSDAVTWKFSQGLRDTPTNAGGMLDTGFLFRTADRTRVQDYWQTIDIEQGGHMSADQAAQQPLLDALARFVNYAIPTPVPPSLDASYSLEGEGLQALRAHGREVFERMRCNDCHDGPALTDSARDNPGLDLSGPVVSAAEPGGVLLHDVGTCASADDAADAAHLDIQGNAREACAFDTPQLRGLWDSAPYLHDGSAATLEDTLPSMLKASVLPDEPAPLLLADDQRALIEYLRGL